MMFEPLSGLSAHSLLFPFKIDFHGSVGCARLFRSRPRPQTLNPIPIFAGKGERWLALSLVRPGRACAQT
jgi:hypothetical protein